MNDVLVLDQVSKIYGQGENEVRALDQIDLAVAPDEIVALLGPSGSGKTTLCTISGGILSPTEGRVVVGGNDITSYSRKKLTEFRRKSVGFVFQSVSLVPFLTARENLLVVGELGPTGVSRSELRERADQLLEELGLAERADNLSSQLSGGQQQRVAIGRALMNQPELVFFDEPTSALDSKIGEKVVKLIRDEMKARGTSAVIVTHDERVTRYADRTVRIEDGKIVEDAPQSHGEEGTQEAAENNVQDSSANSPTDPAQSGERERIDVSGRPDGAADERAAEDAAREEPTDEDATAPEQVTDEVRRRAAD